jgi:transposase
MSQVAGIDVAKATLDVALLDGSGQWQTGRFANSDEGFSRLQRWLEKRSEPSVHICLEATGRYSRGVARYLHEAGYPVSVINPTKTPLYRNLVGQQNKSDASDAKLLAQYCANHELNAWTPPSAHQEQLQELTRYLDTLKREQTRLGNRLAAGPLSDWVLHDLQEQFAALEQRIAALEQEIETLTQQDDDQRHHFELLLSIPGVGRLTAARFLAEVPDLAAFAKASHLAAYAGLVPRHHNSGTSVHKKSRLTKSGNPYLRHAFYMPALSAMRHNPIIRRFADRLAAAGKPKMAIVAAAMHKLLRLAYGVLKSNRPFDPDFVHGTT